MSDTSIKFENVGKLYRLGTVGTGTLSHDLKRWWITSVRGKEDPYLKIGETNDRSSKGSSEYVYALQDINFEVKQGDVLGIIGKNGAGKSTLLKLLSRVTAPTTGKIYTKGRIASLLEVGTGFHPELTGRENIYMNGTIMGMKKWEIDRKLDEIVDFSGCERYLDTPVKRYSSGMMVRLGFAVAAHLEPEILVVDEVLAVGDAEFQKKAIGKMQDVSRGEGRTVLFVSHNMDSMLKLCNRGLLLGNGKMQYLGGIQQTVDTYIKGHASTIYDNNTNNSSIYVSNCYFNGSESNKSGLFEFEDNIKINLTIKKKSNTHIDKNTIAGICIHTIKDVRLCVHEEPLFELQNSNSIQICLSYPSNIMIPGEYIIKVYIHVPNITMINVQEIVAFTIVDKNNTFAKYNGTDNGVVILNPIVHKTIQ